MQYSSVAGAITIKTKIRIGLFCCKTDIKWYCQKIRRFSKFEFWIVRDMLHSQLPHTYQPLDTFVNLMILMTLVHQIWFKNSSSQLANEYFYRMFIYPSPRQFYPKFRMSSYFQSIMFTNKAMFLLAFFGFLRIG